MHSLPKAYMIGQAHCSTPGNSLAVFFIQPCGRSCAEDMRGRRVLLCLLGVPETPR